MEEKNLDQIEILLSLSARGCHHLFNNDEIARVLSKPTEDLDFFALENMDRIQNLFTELIEKFSFNEKERYVSSLDPESREILLRTYFHIVDNSVMAATSFKH
jgi:hypothetical protein